MAQNEIINIEINAVDNASKKLKYVSSSVEELASKTSKQVSGVDKEFRSLYKTYDKFSSNTSKLTSNELMLYTKLTNAFAKADEARKKYLSSVEKYNEKEYALTDKQKQIRTLIETAKSKPAEEYRKLKTQKSATLAQLTAMQSEIDKEAQLQPRTEIVDEADRARKLDIVNEAQRRYAQAVINTKNASEKLLAVQSKSSLVIETQKAGYAKLDAEIQKNLVDVSKLEGSEKALGLSVNSAVMAQSFAYKKLEQDKLNLAVADENLRLAEENLQTIQNASARSLGGRANKEQLLVSAQQQVTTYAEQQAKAYDNVTTSSAKYDQSTNKLSISQEKLATAQNKANITSQIQETAVDAVGKSFNALKLTKVLGLIYAVRRLTSIFKEFIAQSSAFIENMNLLEVAFNDTANSTKNLIKQWSGDLGLNINDLAQYVATFKQMATAMGQVESTAVTMSYALTRVALDVSSLRNVSFETAVQDFASAVAGQVKPVRKYGFDVTMQSIEDLLKTEGIEAVTANMTMAEKQLARTVLLLRSSKLAWGDLTKTINTYANQQKVFEAQWQSLQRVMGDVLLGNYDATKSFNEIKDSAGILAKAIFYLNGAIMAIIETLRAFTPEVLSSGIEDNAIAMKQYADETQEAENATVGLLADFDKFTTLSGTQVGAVDSGLTESLTALLETDYAKYIETVNGRLSKTQQYALEIKQQILDLIFPNFSSSDMSLLEYMQSTNHWLLRLQNTFDSLGEQIFPTLKEIWKAFEPISTMSREAIIAILQLIADILEFTNSLGITKDLILVLLGMKIAKSLIGIGGELTKLISKISITNSTLPLSQSLLSGIGIQISMITGSTYLLTKAIEYFILNIGKMGNAFKILLPILSAALGLTVAFAIAKSGLGAPLAAIAAAGILTTAITLGVGTAISTIPKYATGGIPNSGEMYMANENGKSEFIGRVGNNATVTNQQQMTQILYSAAKQGIIDGLASGAFSIELDGKNIDNSSVAKGLYPALKIVKRQYGE